MKYNSYVLAKLLNDYMFSSQSLELLQLVSVTGKKNGYSFESLFDAEELYYIFLIHHIRDEK